MVWDRLRRQAERDAERVPWWLYDVLVLLVMAYSALGTGVRAVNAASWVGTATWGVLSVMFLGGVAWQVRELRRLSGQRRR